MALGGLCQILVAIFEVIKGSSFSFAVFGVYGAFWIGWSLVYFEKNKTTSTFSEKTYTDGRSLFLGQWGVLTFCFWILTFRKNRALIVVFALLWVTFILLSIASATGETEIRKAAGYVGFVCALGAWYTGVAELVNEEWGRHVLPGLEPLFRPQRLDLSKEKLQELVQYSKSSNTLFLQFRGIQITSPAHVSAIEEVVRSTILASGAKKVHVVADYQDAVIAESVQSLYWEMAAHLQQKYYLSATRFHVSSFGTKNNYYNNNPMSSPLIIDPLVLGRPESSSGRYGLRMETTTIPEEETSTDTNPLSDAEKNV